MVCPCDPRVCCRKTGRKNIDASEDATYPLCPAGHLPQRRGDRQDALPPLYPRPLSWSRPRGISISLPVGEMPGRQRGVSRTHQHPRNPSPDTAKTPP
ncbi:hypothetical protein EGT36_03735 [Agrobacterium sp. FDAARGOS_525]|nr:hypothetical protein EGT36_03735 [Agrobacterium sp. FDAARGOS_525]